jgi:hypothetical protein
MAWMYDVGGETLGGGERDRREKNASGGLDGAWSGGGGGHARGTARGGGGGGVTPWAGGGAGGQVDGRDEIVALHTWSGGGGGGGHVLGGERGRGEGSRSVYRHRASSKDSRGAQARLRRY